MNGEKNSNNYNNANGNNGGFNISNLFDLSKLGNLFGGGNGSRNTMINNPLAGIGRMFGMRNNNMLNRQPRNVLGVLHIEEAYRIIKSGNCFLLDVRTEMEYNTVRIKGSVNIPLDRLHVEFPQMVANKNEKIIIYCATGSRVRRAAQILWALGYNNLNIWEGAGINTFAFADLIVYNNRQIEQNSSNVGGDF